MFDKCCHRIETLGLRYIILNQSLGLLSKGVMVRHFPAKPPLLFICFVVLPSNPESFKPHQLRGQPIMAISNMAVSNVVIWHNITNPCHLEIEITLAQ